MLWPPSDSLARKEKYVPLHRERRVLLAQEKPPIRQRKRTEKLEIRTYGINNVVLAGDILLFKKDLISSLAVEAKRRKYLSNSFHLRVVLIQPLWCC